jgi:general secretion pathway protein K
VTRIPPPRPRERGFVLLIVIWVTGLLALISASFAVAMRTHIKVTANTIENARAEALADAGVNIAIMDLLATRTNRSREGRFAVDGTATVCRAPTGDLLRIAVEDEAGKVDLNIANERLLTTLLQGLGASSGEASAHADSILDFRDADDERRLAGAEQPEYRAVGLAHGPKNAAFHTVEELGQVLGIPAGWMGRLRPLVTVYSGQGGIDPSVASIDLLAALGQSGFPSAAGPFGLNSDARSRQSRPAVPSEFVAASQGRAFTVRSEARLVHGATFVREAVVEFRATRTGTHVFRRWHRGQASPADAPEWAAADGPPC